MRIQAFMPVFNEADVLPHVLRHLQEQGVSVHVLDGWSTDGSYEIAKEESRWGVRPPCGGCVYTTVERFPPESPDSVQRCGAILRRIEDLAADSYVNWCLYTDADEWRRSPFAGETLAQAVARVDAAGFSAVDFRVFQFYPTTNTVSWDEWKRIGPEAAFRYYDQADCISRIPNRKLWKNVGRVCLAGGGHEVMFPGMRVYPQRFAMKHYPFRTPQQARSKIETRMARRCQEEHAKGWGVHYDQYPPDFPFCWDPGKLKFWQDTRSPLPC